MLKHKLVDFIIQFMEEVDKEISEMKLFVCAIVFSFMVAKYTDKLPAECKGEIRSRVIPDTRKLPSEKTCDLLLMLGPVRLENGALPKGSSKDRNILQKHK